MGSIIISLDEKRQQKRDAEEMENIKKPLSEYCYAQKSNSQLIDERERQRSERAEHNARVLRQYKIKG